MGLDGVVDFDQVTRENMMQPTSMWTYLTLHPFLVHAELCKRKTNNICISSLHPSFPPPNSCGYLNTWNLWSFHTLLRCTCLSFRFWLWSVCGLYYTLHVSTLSTGPKDVIIRGHCHTSSSCTPEDSTYWSDSQTGPKMTSGGSILTNVIPCKKWLSQERVVCNVCYNIGEIDTLLYRQWKYKAILNQFL